VLELDQFNVEALFRRGQVSFNCRAHRELQDILESIGTDESLMSLKRF
jgi:hypothetical protein